MDTQIKASSHNLGDINPILQQQSSLLFFVRKEIHSVRLIHKVWNPKKKCKTSLDDKDLGRELER